MYLLFSIWGNEHFDFTGPSCSIIKSLYASLCLHIGIVPIHAIVLGIWLASSSLSKEQVIQAES